MVKHNYYLVEHKLYPTSFGIKLKEQEKKQFDAQALCQGLDIWRGY